MNYLPFSMNFQYLLNPLNIYQQYIQHYHTCQRMPSLATNFRPCESNENLNTDLPWFTILTPGINYWRKDIQI